jgi:hypothetical protein
MPKDISSNINLNINKDDNSVNDFIYCWDQFKKRPNKLTLFNTYVTSKFKEMTDELFIDKNTFSEVLPDENGYSINDKVLAKISNDVFVSFVVIDRNIEDSVTTDLLFLYKEEKSLEKIQELITKLEDCLVDFSDDEMIISNLNTLQISNNSSLEIEPIHKAETEECTESFYNSQTFKEINKVIKKIKKSDRGLSVFYGERGTGKTSIINYLADKLDRQIIFIPNNYIDHTINHPEFKRFLRKYNRPIIIIDDCEMIFNEVFNRSNITVNNLLQLIDGFLANQIDVNIVTIFNVDDWSEIDHSLVECNNLHGIVKFNYLSEKESEDLSVHLESKTKYKEKCKLIDIIKNKQIKETKKIGF